MSRSLPSIVALLAPFLLSAQLDSLPGELNFEADFRFRLEQDWNSTRADGTMRDDRSRMRYRVRAGVEYIHNWYKTGFRLRTGNPIKQQDPQLTLGTGPEEFGTLQIGLEKAYFQGNHGRFRYWVGKNTFPFEKSNELFWSDNVFPDGVFLGQGFGCKSGVIDSVNVSGGHFIISASGRSFDQDNYFQGYQVYLSAIDRRVELFPSFYLFKNTPNIPDGGGSFELDYGILHTGVRITILEERSLKLEFDHYRNLQDLSGNSPITEEFQDQVNGMVAGVKYGRLNEKGDWLFTATYAWLQQFSIVDFMAQNDWARWDYSAFGSPDGRLSNMQGVELVACYALSKRAKLTTKYYVVEQLVPYGSSLETNSRIRFDIDVSF